MENHMNAEDAILVDGAQNNDTVQADVNFTITGARLTEKLAYNEKVLANRISYLESHLERVRTMPEIIEKTNRKTGETEQVTRKEELNAIARREALNNISNGRYVQNIITMRDLNKLRQGGAQLGEEDQKKYTKAKQSNDAIEKKTTLDGNKENFKKQHKRAFVFNCTEDGINKQIAENHRRLENAKAIIDKVKDFPEREFTISIKESRKLSNLVYDQGFKQQIETALQAKQAQEAPPKKAGGRKR